MTELNRLIDILEKISIDEAFSKELREEMKIKNFPVPRSKIDDAVCKYFHFLETIPEMDPINVIENKEDILDKISDFGYLLEEKSKPCDREHIYAEFLPDYFMNQFIGCEGLATVEKVKRFQKELALNLSLYEKADTKEKLLTLAHVFSFIPCLL